VSNNATITRLEARIKKLESELVYTKAIIDGSEYFTREATGYSIALLARYLHEKGIIDAKELFAYINAFKGEINDVEDHHGEIVNNVAGCLQFQMKYPDDFALSAVLSKEASA